MRIVRALVLLVALVCVYNQAIGDNPAPTAQAVSSDAPTCSKSAQCPKTDKSCAKEWKKRCQEKANAFNCDKKPAGCSKKAQAASSKCSKTKSDCGPKPSGCSEKAQAKSACGTKPAGCSKKAQTAALSAHSCEGKDPSKCCPKTN